MIDILKPLKKYKSLSWQENFLGGHFTIGPVTVFGCNAMHYAVNIKSKKYGYICFRLPLTCFGKMWPVYWYCSPDGTPGSATYYNSIFESSYLRSKYRGAAFLRKASLGHNYKESELHDYKRQILKELRNML